MKFFSVLFLLIFFVGFSSSQKLFLGPEIGTNMIMIEKTELGRTYHPGWFFGCNVEYNLTDYFSLRSGVYFSQRKKMYQSADTSQLSVFGFDLSSLGIPGADFSVYSKTKGVVSQYGIEMPLLAAFNFKGFSLFAGPYINVMVHAWTKETTDEHIPFLQTFNIDSLDPSGILGFFFPPAVSHTFTESSSKTNLRGFDYGFKMGVGYTVEKMRINLYYNLGIPDYRIDLGTDEAKPHHYFSACLNYNFEIGKRGGRSSFGD